MNKIALTLAALAALSGSAFAGALDADKQAPAQTSIQTPVDYTSTGSVEKTHSAVNTGSTETNKPRLGYDASPFVFQGY